MSQTKKTSEQKQTNEEESQFRKERLMKILLFDDKEFEKVFEKSDSEKLQSTFKSICFLGVTGHGKSSTANTLAGKNHFRVSAGVDSATL